ncbi:MAG: alkaline phosphatase family protein [Actinomycetota bacterium]|nr:alkaline phosphatase family protein [Actinomycetota bacterium]
MAAPTVAPEARFTPMQVERVTEPAAGWRESGCSLPVEYVRRIRRGNYPGRSPDVIVVPREPNFFGAFTSTSHSGPWDYLQKVPLVFYGPGFIQPQGDLSLDREVTVADLAPTMAELLDVEFPTAVGKPIEGVLDPTRDGPPKLIVTVVWDGGGWNTLRTWPDQWPHLEKLMAGGTSVQDVIVGSSPSVTPAIHTNIGTGAFPKQHGTVGIPIREEDGSMSIAFDNKSPDHVEVPMLGDTYDAATGNAAEIGMFAFKGWHMGMMSHGALTPGGDKDIAILANTQEKFVTNPSLFEVPPYVEDIPGLDEHIRTVDQADGELDDKWMGHEVLDQPSERRDTPAWTLFQTKIIKTVLSREGFGADEVPDLFFTNYKQIDEIGHNFNLLQPEMRAIVRYSDEALKDLTDFLNREVGHEEWVLALTADHGVAPDPQAAGAWPIRMQYLQSDVAEHFGVGVQEMFVETSPVGFWFDQQTMEAEGITSEEVADFLVDYRLDANAPAEEDLPSQYRDRLEEPIFEAAFPSAAMGEIWNCVEENG